MRRTFCIALIAAFAAASAQADIRQAKPVDRHTVPHAGIRPGKGTGVKDLFADCAAFIAARRTKAMIPLSWIETCADASRPADSAPAGQQPKISGPSIVRGPGACSVVGEVGRSC